MDVNFGHLSNLAADIENSKALVSGQRNETILGQADNTLAMIAFAIPILTRRSWLNVGGLGSVGLVGTLGGEIARAFSEAAGAQGLALNALSVLRLEPARVDALLP